MKTHFSVFKFLIFLLIAGLGLASTASAQNPDYHLLKNPENYGLLIFPKDVASPDLQEFLGSLEFKSVESGKTVMRFGEKKENMTYMMPQEVQEKHGIKKFIILQILAAEKGIMVGIFEQQYGLTLPPTIYKLEEVKKNIPKTLGLFRDQDGQRKT